MKPNFDKYLSEQNELNNSIIHAGRGERKFGANGWGFTEDPNFFGADGQPAPPTDSSQPYIITVSNASAASVGNFDIWWAAQYLNTSQYTWSNGSLTVNGVTISAAVNNSNVTYYTMLQQSQNQPFVIARTQIVVLSGQNGQINQGYSLKTIDMNGNEFTKYLPFVIQPTQFQSGTLVAPMVYRIDQSTILRTTIFPSTVFQLYFYPSDQINQSRLFNNQAPNKSFAPPQVGAQEIKLIN